MREANSLKKLLLLLLLVVLLPALFYSGYEVSTINSTEQLIGSIYSRQLDVILFSLNQYALDVANNWVSATSLLLSERQASSPDSLHSLMERFLQKNSSVSSVAVTDTLFTVTRFYHRPQQGTAVTVSDSSIVHGIRAQSENIERLLKYQKNNYRKIEPVYLTDAKEQKTLALLTVMLDGIGMPVVVTYVIHEQQFINSVLAPKLQEAAGDEFILAMYSNAVIEPLYSTSPVKIEQLKQHKQLWLFPNHQIGICLKGTTIEELAQSRFTRNILLIALVDVVLIIGVWVVYRNIRKQLEFVRLKSDFVSNVSHELRTPLALIRMFAETLEMGRAKNEEKRQEYYRTILQETERLTRLINKILDFSRMEAGKKEYQLRSVDFNELVARLLETYSAHFKAKGFEPVVYLKKGVPSISADRESLTEACMNIIDNAIKYSGDEKYLRIETGQSEDGVYFEVEDHGIGIAQEHHKKIFENFFRVSGALVHDVKGSGLGLALVKHIIDAHQGSITLNSTPGKGSTFRLVFPAEKQNDH